MTPHSFDSQRIAEGYARRPWLHKTVMEQIRKDCNLRQLKNGLDVGCGAGLSTKALRMLCDHVTGTDISPEMIAVCKALYQDPSYTFSVSRAEETEMPAEPYDIITAAGVMNWVDRELFLKNAEQILAANGLIVVYDFWITDRMEQSPEYTEWYQKKLNWVDRELFLKNAEQILAANGLIVVYDFWITDRMEQSPEYTEWYQKKYLNRFPKPYRKEAVWSQQDLTAAFRLENRVTYDLTYEFSLDEFIDFMMIQSNVNEQIEKNVLSSEDTSSVDTSSEDTSSADTSSAEARNWMADTLHPIFNGRRRTLLFEGYNWYIRKK